QYLEQADVLESRLQDGPAAAAAYKRALEVQPGNTEAMSALEQLYRRRGDFAALVEVLDERADAARGDESSRLQKEAAALLAERDRKQAIQRYEGLREIALTDREVVHALAKLYEAEGRTEDYLSALGAEADLSGDDRERLNLYRRLASEWEA